MQNRKGRGRFDDLQWCHHPKKKLASWSNPPDCSNVPLMYVPPSTSVNCLSVYGLASPNSVSQWSSSEHNNDISLSDADISPVSSATTCLPDVSSLSFHSALSNNLTSPLVHASSQIPSYQGMRFLSSNIDSHTNKLSELSFHMKPEGVDVVAITEVSPKNTLSATSPDKLKSYDYQLFSNLNSPLSHRGVCLYIRDGLNISLI